MSTELTLDALEQVLWARLIKGNLIHHADQGSSMSLSGILSGSLRLGAKHRSVQSAMIMIMHWPKRSMVFSRPNSSVATALGRKSTTQKMPPSNEFTGSIQSDYSGRSVMYRLRARDADYSEQQGLAVGSGLN